MILLLLLVQATTIVPLGWFGVDSLLLNSTTYISDSMATNRGYVNTAVAAVDSVDKALYADSARIAEFADSARIATFADSTRTATYADSARIAECADSTRTSLFADSCRASGLDSTGLFRHNQPLDSTHRIYSDTVSSTRGIFASRNVYDTGRIVKITSSSVITDTFYCAGLDDMTPSGFYAGHKTVDTFFVKIKAVVANSDTFQWKQGRTGSYSAATKITKAKQNMAVGCSLAFVDDSGHTAGDSWAIVTSAPAPFHGTFASGNTWLKVFPDGAIQSGAGSVASGLQSVVIGGYNNTASGNYATVAGGGTNTASGIKSYVGGGSVNDATADNAMVGGGYNNDATGTNAAITGGYENKASGQYSFVGSGYNNYALGYMSFIPGGRNNIDSAPYSGAFGDSLRVRAGDTGAFVIGMGHGAGRLTSTGKHQTLIGGTSANTVFWDDDSQVVKGGVKFIAHGKSHLDSLATFGAGSADSVTISVGRIFADSAIYVGGQTAATASVAITDSGIELRGAAAFWQDLAIGSIAMRPGVSAPTLATSGAAGGLRSYGFATNATNEIEFTAQTQHGMAETADIHIHWMPTTTDTGHVVWGFEYSVAPIESAMRTVDTLWSDVSGADTGSDAGGTAWKAHMSHFDGDIYFPTNSISNIIICRVFRFGTHADDTYPEPAQMLSIDFHVKYRRLGSRLQESY